MEINKFQAAIELAILASWHTQNRSTNGYYIEHARNNTRIIVSKCEPWLLINGDGISDSCYLLFAILCGISFAYRGEPTYNELESLLDEAMAIHSRQQQQ